MRVGDADPGLEDRLNSQGTSQAELQDTLTSDPIFRRANELTRLGLREQASWELDGLIERASQHAHPVAVKFMIANTEMNLGYTSRALRTAESTAKEQGFVRTNLPSAFQRLLMPLAFEDSLAAGSSHHGSDALLLAAVVRQESRFDPMARSSANALGFESNSSGNRESDRHHIGRRRSSARTICSSRR